AASSCPSLPASSDPLGSLTIAFSFHASHGLPRRHDHDGDASGEPSPRSVFGVRCSMFGVSLLSSPAPIPFRTWDICRDDRASLPDASRRCSTSLVAWASLSARATPNGLL